MIQQRSAVIDGLRGLAILLVLLSHLSHGGNAPTFLNWGGYGVTLFIVLSGFCIHQRWARASDPSAPLPRLGPFWKKRLFRLYPAYAVAVALTFALLIKSGGGLTDWTTDLLVLALMLQNCTSLPDRLGNGPLWSLALEEQLYWLYFPMLAMRRRLGWGGTLAAVMLVQTLWRLLWWLNSDPPYHYTIGWPALGPSRWLAWVLGAVAVEAWSGRLHLPKWTRSRKSLMVLLCLALALTPPAGQWWLPGGIYVVREALWGLVFFVLVNCALRWGWFSWLAGLGRVSYSLYLVHYPLMMLIPEAHPVFRLTLALLGGCLLYLLVERPTLANQMVGAGTRTQLAFGRYFRDKVDHGARFLG